MDFGCELDGGSHWLARLLDMISDMRYYRAIYMKLWESLDLGIISIMEEREALGILLEEEKIIDPDRKYPYAASYLINEEEREKHIQINEAVLYKHSTVILKFLFKLRNATVKHHLDDLRHVPHYNKSIRESPFSGYHQSKTTFDT